MEYNRFSKKQDCPKDLKEIKGSKVIYVGAIDQRFDINAVKVLSKNCPDINIIIIGPYDSNKKMN